ncbi:hypothetical protein DFH06DRAFT_1443143 [Mycena polygramma]|nr:hypothetical protein DFH06DRAFT_1443143 [Mycena polygramma]
MPESDCFSLVPSFISPRRARELFTSVHRAAVPFARPGFVPVCGTNRPRPTVGSGNGGRFKVLPSYPILYEFILRSKILRISRSAFAQELVKQMCASSQFWVAEYRLGPHLKLVENGSDRIGCGDVDIIFLVFVNGELTRALGAAAVAAMPVPRRTLHDKTSYSILPTPPSPRHNSPSPSLSPSNSNSAGSTATEPTTPPSQSRGRPRKDRLEGVGRVPLHRRGTSKTYERLEDLLREAGYKETRIFTPETERTVPQDETKSPKIGAAFVGFLSNLVPSRSASLAAKEEPEIAAPVYSPPASPSLASRTPRPPATRQQPRGSNISNAATIVPRVPSPLPRISVPRDGQASGPSSALSPNGALSPRRSFVDMQQPQRARLDSVVSPLPSDNHPPLHHPVPARPVNRYYQHHPSSSRGSGVSSPPFPPPVPVHHPTPTRASTYLRHMTSYDRPQSTPPTSTYARVTDGPEDESLLSPTLAPRMPTNWMDNVKRAREYFGPAPPLPPISGAPANANANTAKLGRSVSAKTRGRLSDRTNATGHVPPLLTTRLTETRARRSESQVSVGRVVCRSRGSSPVRRDKGKTRAADLDLRGQLELPGPDELDLDRGLARSRFLGGWGTATAGESAQLLSPPRRRGASSSASSSAVDSAESDVSSEGEDEITLARILVPSRHATPAAMERSRSVRSLRRCLELGVQGQGQGDVPPVPPLPLPNAGSGRWSVSLSWGRARGAGEHDAEDPEVYASAASGRGSQRQRGVLPAWGA